MTAGHVYAVRVCAKRGAARAPCAWTWARPDEAPGKPAAPAVATRSRASLGVSWRAPSNGGTAITDYDVRYKLSSASGWTTHGFTGAGTSTTLTGLAADAGYDVQVRAGNRAGRGPYSDSGSGTPHGRPGRPAKPSVSVAGGTSLAVGWRAPAYAGDTAITDYDVRHKSAGGSWRNHPFNGAGVSTTITGLTAGAAYSVQVRAGNTAGEGAYSPSGTGTPDEKPGRPSAPGVAAASASGLRATWTAPSNNGTAITDYDVRYKKSTASRWTAHAFSGAGVSTTIAGLTLGASYAVRVRAGNAAGEGAYSPSGTGTVDVRPGAPGAPSVTSAGATSVRVAWAAPSNSGTAITDYDVRYKLATASGWTNHSFDGTGTATTITGLTSGASYAAQVRAANAAGAGPYSPSGSGGPRGTPGTPAAPTVSAAGATSLRVVWTAPSSGGSPITDYDVRYKRAAASGWTNHPFTGTGTATTISGLGTGVAHAVEVRAVNVVGAGEYSPSGTGTPNQAPGRPAAPTVAPAGGGSVRVDWTAPSNSGTAITGYDVRYKSATASGWTRHPFAGTGTSTTIAGLSLGATYSAQVRAVNAAGAGPYSASGSGGPASVPGAPAAPTVSAASASSLRVVWTAPSSGGSPITDYDVEYKTTGARTWKSHPFTGAGTATTISGLVVGFAYAVRVRAENAVGDGPFSPAGTATADVAPGRPAAPTVTAGSGGSLLVFWTAPANTGTNITGYDVRHRASGASLWTAHATSGAGRSITITGLVAGTPYDVQVRAVNNAGAGSWSPSGTAYPDEAPGKPAAPAVSAASGSSLEVSWTAPANGGTAIKDYDVRHKPGAGTAWTAHPFTGTATSTAITGLAAGTAYDVQVRAGNDAGAGGWSNSGRGTPNEVPGRPAAPVVAPLATSTVSVVWTAPANGGTAITDYDVRYKRSGASGWTDHPFTDTATSTAITGLTKDAAYAVRVRAGNIAGKGEYSPSGSGAPADVPRFTARYDFGSHAILLDFDRAPVDTAEHDHFHGVEERFAKGDPFNAATQTDQHRRRNPGRGGYAYRARFCQRELANEDLAGGVTRPLPPRVTCGPWSASVSVTVSGDGPFAAEPSLVAATVPGNLPYDLGVTKGGDAYVNIPIQPAPGVGGLEPRLSIDYGGGRERQRLDSHQPADLLGYGWRVGGLSAIHRCVKNRAGANTITFTSRDGLCLDGEPLLLISGTALANGAQYRTYRESFAKVVAKGAGEALWFEAKLPDGSTRQYGNTADSRLLFRHPANTGGDNLIWSLNRHTDSFGNAVTYDYHEDENAVVRHPREISYGDNGDAKLQFVYAARADAETVTQGGAERARHLLLHTVRAVLDGKVVREYRLLSETTDKDWRRLDKVQLCGYGETGATSSRECLRHLEVDWVDTTIAAPGYKTCVNRIEEPLGRVTAFEYGTIKSTGTHDFLFAERPFGEHGTPTDTEPLPAASDGTVKPVVTAMTREDGVGGARRVSYAYQGKGLRSAMNWGFLGFPATRTTDATNGVVTYRQFRMDDPHFGALAAEHAYDGVFGGSTVKTLSKRFVERAAHPFAHGAATTTLPYARRETVLHYEGGTALGATRTEWTRSHAGNLPTGATRTITAGSGSLGAVSSTATWGATPAYTFTTTLRKWETTFDLQNRVAGANWLVGFPCQTTEKHYKGSGATADRKRWMTRKPRTGGMEPAEVVRFGALPSGCGSGATDNGDSAALKLTTIYAYDPRGNVASETTRSETAGHVPSRATRASNFVDGRYPGTLTNAAGHAERVEYDPRFGVPKRVVDANGRVTLLSRDAFGRVTAVTSPDGVVAGTRRWRCAGATCASVSAGGVTAVPAMAVETTSPIAPTTTTYLDELGRAVRVETQAFSGAHDIREDTVYDARGRVFRRSVPHFANAASPAYSAYEYDNLDRTTRETRPDGGVTTRAYAAANGAVTETVTEKVYAGSTLAATLTTVNTYDVLGELVSVTEDSGGDKAAATTFVRDGSGLLASVAVGARTTSFAYDAAGHRTSTADPNFGAATFARTALGQLRQRTDALGNRTTYSRDVLGRLTGRDDPDGKARWVYDTAANGKGMLHKRCQGPSTVASDTCGGTQDHLQTLAYGTDARPSSATTALRADGLAKSYAHGFAYDPSGRLSSVTHPSGVTVGRTYNSRGHLWKVTEASSPKPLVTYTGADAFGNVTGETYRNGMATARTFDPATGRQTGGGDRPRERRVAGGRAGGRLRLAHGRDAARALGKMAATVPSPRRPQSRPGPRASRDPVEWPCGCPRVRDRACRVPTATGLATTAPTRRRAVRRGTRPSP